MAKFEQNLSKSILDSGFVLHIMIPRSIIFSFLVFRSGRDVFVYGGGVSLR